MRALAIEHVECELLGDRAAAAVPAEFNDGADHCFSVDAGVFIEAFVFSGDQGVDDIGRDVLIVDMEAVAFVDIEFTHRNAVIGKDFGGQAEGRVLQFLEGGQFAEGAFRDADDEDDKAQEAGEQDDPEDANGFAHSILLIVR